MSAEAACTEGFLEYIRLLVSRQQLDRIVVDECYLIITAGDYCVYISQLGWYIRQVRIQTVWLTATLPLSIQDDFLEYNKLVQPRIIRELTNWPNIKYIVSRYIGPITTLAEVAVELVRAHWPRRQASDRDRV